MTVTPSSALADLPVAVTVSGLPAGTRTTVTAAATDRDGVRWTSSADFQAGADGTVSLAQKPLSGYPAADPMGLFELMTPAGGTRLPYFVAGGPLDVSLRATAGGRTVAEATAHRVGAQDAGVRVRELRPAPDGIYGTLYLPADTSVRRPALVVFGGSEGGLGTGPAAALLAAHGYPALALAYFGEPGLPATLRDVPLEYFAKALTLLRAQPGVDPDHVLVQGTSRGGEGALLVGATYPALVNGVVAGVPSNRAERTPFVAAVFSAWTVRGRPVPPGTEIPVERIRGPVLMNCGGQDGIWPSCPQVDAVALRLKQHHFRYPVTALEYPDGGHSVGGFSTFYTSWTDAALDPNSRGLTPGGTLPATLAGVADSHAKLLALLSSL